MLGQLALQVTGSVIVNNICLRYFIYGTDNLWQELFSLGLIGHGSQTPNLRTHLYFLVAIQQTTLFALTDSLLC